MTLIKRPPFIIVLCLATLTSILLASCANSTLVRFKKNIQTMPDADLLSCYHGINERIKDIDHRNKRDELSKLPSDRSFSSKQADFFGGEIYDLIQKEKIVLKELRKRKIDP